MGIFFPLTFLHIGIIIESNMYLKDVTRLKKSQVKNTTSQNITRRLVPVPDDVWRLVKVEKAQSDRQYGDIVTDCIRRVLGGA